MRNLSLIESRRFRPEPGRGFNLFAYGSLMWRPDFAFVERLPARLFGYHRAFCISSTHYRGTRERPGLVLGLDRGGMCHGRLFTIAAEDAEAVADYLHDREMLTACYEPRQIRPRLADGTERQALAYVADRRHEQYAGKLSPEEVVARICGASGVMGSNLDYLRQTIAHLEDMGIQECGLHRLLDLVEKAAPVEETRAKAGR